MTFACEDDPIDASLNTHRWVDTGWSDPFPHRRPCDGFFCPDDIGATRTKKCPTSMAQVGRDL